MLDNPQQNLVRTLSIFFIIWALFGPINIEIVEFRRTLLGSTWLSFDRILWLVKSMLIATSVILLFRPTRVVALAIQLVTGCVFLYMGVVSNYWNYNTHTLIIMCLTFIASIRLLMNPQDCAAVNSDLVTAVSLVFATIYFQAALSKIVVSGVDWMNSGVSIYLALLKFNPALSAALDGNRSLFQIAGWATVVGELALGVLFVVPKTRSAAAVISVLFHLMLWLSFRISFWHLWIFYPAVFARIHLSKKMIRSRHAQPVT